MTNGYTISKGHDGERKPIDNFKNFFHPEVTTGRLFDFGWVVRDEEGFVHADDDELFRDLLENFPTATGSVIEARLDYVDAWEDEGQWLAALDADGEWIPLNGKGGSYPASRLELIRVVHKAAA